MLSSGSLDSDTVIFGSWRADAAFFEGATEPRFLACSFSLLEADTLLVGEGELLFGEDGVDDELLALLLLIDDFLEELELELEDEEDWALETSLEELCLISITGGSGSADMMVPCLEILSDLLGGLDSLVTGLDSPFFN